jgi:hypothetical protein
MAPPPCIHRLTRFRLFTRSFRLARRIVAELDVREALGDGCQSGRFLLAAQPLKLFVDCGPELYCFGRLPFGKLLFPSEKLLVVVVVGQALLNAPKRIAFTDSPGLHLRRRVVPSHGLIHRKKQQRKRYASGESQPDIHPVLRAYMDMDAGLVMPILGMGRRGIVYAYDEAHESCHGSKDVRIQQDNHHCN